MADYFLLENGSGHLLLENGSDGLLLEVQSAPSTGDYLVQEPDGTSRFTLEDGSGFILLEAATPPTPEVVHGGGIIIQRRRPIIRIDQYHLEEDEAIALSLLLRTRRKRSF